MTRIQQVATKLAAVSVEQWLHHPDKEELMQRIAEELSQLPEFSPSPFVRHWEPEPKSSVYAVPDQVRRDRGY